MNRKEQIRELWQICFNDTEEFVRFYFDDIYKEEQALTIEKEGKLVSALQMIPYTLHWCGKDWSVAYISGACTSPAERGKGLMRELLQKAFEEMRKKGYDLTALIPAEPWLFDYYRGQGYTEAFDYERKTYLRPAGEQTSSSFSFLSLNKQPDESWYSYFDKKLRQRTACILHTQDDFHCIIKDILMSKGLILGAQNEQGHPVGLAFAVLQEGKFDIKEVLYDSEEVLQALLRELSEAFNTPEGYYKQPPSLPDVQTERLGMAMILNKDKMISHWLETHINPSFSLEELQVMETKALTATLLGYGKRETYMSLMMD